MMKELEIYIESSYFVALLVKNHPFHIKAKDIFKNNLYTQWVLSFLTIDETVYVLLKYGQNKMKVSEILINIIESSGISYADVEINTSKVSDYLSLWTNQNLKPRDAMHAFIMKENGLKQIATFDNDFIKNQKKLGIKVIK